MGPDLPRISSISTYGYIVSLNVTLSLELLAMGESMPVSHGVCMCVDPSDTAERTLLLVSSGRLFRPGRAALLKPRGKAL